MVRYGHYQQPFGNNWFWKYLPTWLHFAAHKPQFNNSPTKKQRSKSKNKKQKKAEKTQTFTFQSTSMMTSPNFRYQWEANMFGNLAKNIKLKLGANPRMGVVEEKTYVGNLKERCAQINQNDECYEDRFSIVCYYVLVCFN